MYICILKINVGNQLTVYIHLYFILNNYLKYIYIYFIIEKFIKKIYFKTCVIVFICTE